MCAESALQHSGHALLKRMGINARKAPASLVQGNIARAWARTASNRGAWRRIHAVCQACESQEPSSSQSPKTLKMGPLSVCRFVSALSGRKPRPEAWSSTTGVAALQARRQSGCLGSSRGISTTAHRCKNTCPAFPGFGRLRHAPLNLSPRPGSS